MGPSSLVESAQAMNCSRLESADLIVDIGDGPFGVGTEASQSTGSARVEDD
jgi:hypothetical protein